MTEFLVLSVAIILLYLFLPVVVIFYMIKYLLTGNKRELKVWFFRSAREIDVFANVVGADLFNAIFITNGGYKFGNPKETISSVLGKNQRDKTLSLAGDLLRWILDLIDDNHCLNSINDDVTNTKKDISK
tara:strand:- start:15254 stop:15643 length:390 start_codon:yes stop_codon:yes gene_type:complete